MAEQNIMTQDDPLKALKNSTMFHFSLGSKELFHSNFLHWLHIIDTENFIKLMRKFADHENDQFWWEEKYYKKEGESYEVRRESNNFDLSIWINLEYPQQNNPKDAMQDNKKVKWVPVLVLENKMKSLAHQDQLENYVNKAYEEWGITKLKDCKEKSPITFILLSLVEDKSSYDVNYECETGRKTKKTISYKSKWINKTYNDLYLNIKSFIKNDNSLNDQIIKDYQLFIGAMYCLGKSWKVQDSTRWKNVLPQEDLKKLRINDAHQKFCYSQIEQLLIDKLNDKEITTNSSFSNGIGLVDAGINVGNLKFLVQVQRNSYRRAIFCKGKDALLEAEEDKALWRKFFILDNDKIDYPYFNEADNSSRIVPSSNKKPQGKGGFREKFHFFKQEFAYQCVAIKDETEIEIIVDAIVKDITDMKNEISNPQNNKQL